MQKIGLTGNIGSGKTRICKIFEALGVPIYYADLEARKILNKPSTIKAIGQLFGQEVVLNPREIDRKKLGAIVFNDSSSLNKLNQVIHPLLKAHFKKWCRSHLEQDYIIQEAAILFENGFNPMMDATITVAAPMEVRLQRVMERDALTKEEVLARMGQQWTDEEKEQAADFVIYNDGSQMLLPQVLKLHQFFKEQEL